MAFSYYSLDDDGDFIYFIVSEDGFVKIGKSRTNPYYRLSSLQTGNPHKLELKLAIKGHPIIEKLMHKLLQKYHYRGEWYRFEGVLKQFITYPHSMSLVIKDLYFVETKQMEWVF